MHVQDDSVSVRRALCELMRRKDAWRSLVACAAGFLQCVAIHPCRSSSATDGRRAASNVVACRTKSLPSSDSPGFSACKHTPHTTSAPAGYTHGTWHCSARTARTVASGKLPEKPCMMRLQVRTGVLAAKGAFP